MTLATMFRPKSLVLCPLDQIRLSLFRYLFSKSCIPLWESAIESTVHISTAELEFRDLYSLYSAVNLIVILFHVLLSLAVGAVAVDILTRISAIESQSLKRGTRKYFSVLVSILCLLTVCQSVRRSCSFLPSDGCRCKAQVTYGHLMEMEVWWS